MSFEWSVRLLACQFQIIADCDRLAASLTPMLQHATQDYPVSHHHRFEVHQEDGRYRIEENGAARTFEPTPESVGYAVCARVHQLALAALPGFTKVHAGCATWQGRRLLAVGPAHSGKTTLMTRLLFEGFAVHGDELVVLRGGEAVPFPRRFGLRPRTLALIPQLAGFARPGPVALDPSQLGFDWRITPGPVDAVFFLEPNHRGRSELHLCPQHLMAQRVMSQSTPPNTGRRGWLSDVCAILTQAGCYILRLGDLDTAVAVVKDGLRAAPTVAA